MLLRRREGDDDAKLAVMKLARQQRAASKSRLPFGRQRVAVQILSAAAL